MAEIIKKKTVRNIACVAGAKRGGRGGGRGGGRKARKRGKGRECLL